MKRNWVRFSMWWPPLVTAILFIMTWHLATVFLDIQKWILPSPLEIFREAVINFERVWFHTSATIQMTLIGFSAGILVGITLAIILHLNPFVKSAIYPFLILSQNIPIIALAPLLMIWFGLGMFPKVLMIVIVCFYPITLSTLNGLHQVDRTILHYMEMSGASKWQIFSKLELPNTVPFLFSGLKISATYSVMAAFIAEWLGSSRGIGAYMLISKSAYRTDRVFVGIIVILCLSIILFSLIVLLEKWFTRWRKTE